MTYQCGNSGTGLFHVEFWTWELGGINQPQWSRGKKKVQSLKWAAFHWVTAQITGCPRGRRGNPQQSGGENTPADRPKHRFLERSTVGTIKNPTRCPLSSANGIPFVIECRKSTAKELTECLIITVDLCGGGSKNASLSGGWPHILPCSQLFHWEWTEPSSSRLPASVHPRLGCDTASNDCSFHYLH